VEHRYFFDYLIGITILAGLSNDKFDLYYDWHTYTINFEVINQKIQRLKNSLGYSHELVSLIARMLV